MYSAPTLHKVNGLDFKAQWQRKRRKPKPLTDDEFWDHYDQIRNAEFDKGMRLLMVPVGIAACIYLLIGIAQWLSK